MTQRPVVVPDSFQRSIQTTRVQYRRLGTSGLKISNPILGGLSIGSSKWMDWVLDEDQALPLLKQAFDWGVNTWDTANVYSNGRSEEIMGAAMRKYSIPRRKVIIMTKVYRVMPDVELPKDHEDRQRIMAFLQEEAGRSKDYVNQSGLSRGAIFQSVDDSLKRLGTDYIDVLHIHRFDHEVPPEEVMRALHDLVVGGKVRYLGASSMWAHELCILQHTAEKLNLTPFSCVQVRYNLIYREEEREMIRYCKRAGLGILAWEPLASGFLARPPSNACDSPRLASSLQKVIQDGSEAEVILRVHRLAQRKQWPMSHVVLAWLNSRVLAPVIGFRSLEHMDEVLSTRCEPLSIEEEKYLEEPYRPRPVVGHL